MVNLLRRIQYLFRRNRMDAELAAERDRLDGETPYEDRPVVDAELFRTFSERVAPVWTNWGYEPLLAKAWALAGTIGAAFTAVRRRYEREWGCWNAEITVSRALLKRYKDNLAAFRAKLHEFCTRRGIVCLFTSTQVPFETLVLTYLRQRGLVR